MILKLPIDKMGNFYYICFEVIMNQNIKRIYDKCKPYLDPEFTESSYDNNLEIQPDRNCELLFTEFMIDNSMKLVGNKTSSAGLDLRVNDIARPGSDRKNGWAEFICPHHKQDVKQNPYKDEDDFLSRITLAIQTKKDKINSDIQKDRVKETEPVIVCVNLDEILDYDRDMFIMFGIEGCVPSVLRTVYPIGEVKATINLTNPGKSKIGQDYQAFIRRVKPNKTEIKVPTDIFLNKEYRQISAVLFNYSKFNNNFILVHNYWARNPIKRKMFKNCFEYIATVFNEKDKEVLKLKRMNL